MSGDLFLKLECRMDWFTPVAWCFKNPNKVHLLTLFVVIACIGCTRDFEWKIQRQVLDEENFPLSGVRVEVIEWRDPHRMGGFFLGDSKNAWQMRTDSNGLFSVRAKCRVLSVKLSKTGYLPKKYSYDRASATHKALPLFSVIELAKDRDMPAPDGLDLNGAKQLLITFPPGKTNLVVNMMDNKVVTCSDTNAELLFHKLHPSGLKVEGLHGAKVLGREWEAGLTMESWKIYYRVMPAGPFQPTTELKCPFWRGSVDANSFLFVQINGSSHRPYYARAYIATITPEEYELYINLSEDTFFIEKPNPGKQNTASAFTLSRGHPAPTR